MEFQKQYSFRIFFSIGAATLFAPWTIRNYKVTNGEIIPLEKYYGDPMDYGMPNVYFRNWISCWINPTNYSSENVSNLMIANLHGNDSLFKKTKIDSIVNNLPSRAFIGNDKAIIHTALCDLFQYYKYKNQPEYTREFDSVNVLVTKEMRALKSNFIKKSALDYYVVTPLLFAKSVIFQSNSTSLTFLDNYQEIISK